jgi:hypothetical protein
MFKPKGSKLAISQLGIVDIFFTKGLVRLPLDPISS